MVSFCPLSREVIKAGYPFHGANTGMKSGYRLHGSNKMRKVWNFVLKEIQGTQLKIMTNQPEIFDALISAPPNT